MTTTPYDIGDLVRCTGEFTTAAGVHIDPTAVSFKVKPPSGVVTIYAYGTDAELVKDEIGIYHVDVDANEEGRWSYRFSSAGSGQAAGESSFYVQHSMVEIAGQGR